MDLLDAIEITKTEKKDYQFFVEFSEREDKYSPEVYFIDGAHIDFIRSDTEIEILFEFDFNYFYKKLKQIIFQQGKILMKMKIHYYFFKKVLRN